MPGSASSGVNATIVVSAEKITGTAILCVPATAASRAGNPRSASPNTFSPITIALSTTMPIARMKPNREIMLIEIPSQPITTKEATKATPMPAAAQNARRKSRKSVRQSITSASPIAAFLNSRSFLPWSSFASFCHTLTSMPTGSDGSKLSRR